MPTHNELAAHYNNCYSYKNIISNEIHQTSSILYNKILAKFIYKKIICKKNKIKFLDYGSGIGNLIFELMKLDISKNITFAGVENNLVARNYSNKKFLKKIVSKKLKKNTYDIVTMIEVIEHLEKPWTEINNIYHSMSVGGKIIITTPNLKGINHKITGVKWREQLEPTHLVLFEKKTLNMLLTNIGFREIEFIRFYPVSYNNRLKQLKNIFFQLLGWHGGICVVATK